MEKTNRQNDYTEISLKSETHEEIERYMWRRQPNLVSGLPFKPAGCNRARRAGKHSSAIWNPGRGWEGKRNIAEYREVKNRMEDMKKSRGEA